LEKINTYAFDENYSYQRKFKEQKQLYYKMSGKASTSLS